MEGQNPATTQPAIITLPPHNSMPPTTGGMPPFPPMMPFVPSTSQPLAPMLVPGLGVMPMPMMAPMQMVTPPATAPPPTTETQSSKSDAGKQENGVQYPPNFTVYVRNINEKVKREALIEELTKIFAKFGQVLEVVALKTVKMRGQAFVVFDTIESAQKAVDEMQDFKFHDQKVQVTFAKTTSDAIAKRDGTFVPRDRKPDAKRKRELDEAKRKRKEKRKTEDTREAPQEDPFLAQQRAAQARTNAPARPTNVLFVEGLHDQCDEMTLSVLFSQFVGYKESRLVPGNVGIAFVEFETEPQATTAMLGLQGFDITEQHKLKISYRK